MDHQIYPGIYLIAASFIFFLTFPIHAENLAHTDDTGTHKYFTDIKTGNHWRTLKDTEGMSYEAAQKQLENNNEFQDWKIATEQEVKVLVSNTLEIPVAELDKHAVSQDARLKELIQLLGGANCNLTLCIAGIVSDIAPTCSANNARKNAQCHKFIKIGTSLVENKTEEKQHTHVTTSSSTNDECDNNVIQPPDDRKSPCVLTYGDVLPDMPINKVVWLPKTGVYLVRPPSK